MTSPLKPVPLRAQHVPEPTPGDNVTPIRPVLPVPEWLTEGGKAVWERLARLYPLVERDEDEFAAFCETIAEYQSATEMIGMSDLMVIDSASGNAVANPALGIRDRADRKLMAWANRFRG